MYSGQKTKSQMQLLSEFTEYMVWMDVYVCLSIYREQESTICKYYLRIPWFVSAHIFLIKWFMHTKYAWLSLHFVCYIIFTSSRERVRAVSEYLSKAIRTISLQQFWNCQAFVLVSILRNSHTVCIEGLVPGIFTFYVVVIQDNFREKKRCTILWVCNWEIPFNGVC